MSSSSRDQTRTTTGQPGRRAYNGLQAGQQSALGTGLSGGLHHCWTGEPECHSMLVAIVGVDIPRVPWTGPLAPGCGAGWADDVGPHGQAGAGHTPVGDWSSPTSRRWGRVGRWSRSTWPGWSSAGHTPSRRLGQPNLQVVGQGGQMTSVHMARLEFRWPYPSRRLGQPNLQVVGQGG